MKVSERVDLERHAWHRADAEVPPAFTTILLWITGSSLHSRLARAVMRRGVAVDQRLMKAYP